MTRKPGEFVLEPELTGLDAIARLLKRSRSQSASANMLGRYASIVERIGLASVELKWPGLLEICTHFAAAIRRLSAGDGALSIEAIQGLHDWVSLIGSYEEHPRSDEGITALLAHLQRECWGTSLSESEYTDLLQMLCAMPRNEPPAMDDPRTGKK